MAKGCGSCRLCCSVMGVDMSPHPEPFKPVYTPCRHECKKGCGIYEIRPEACKVFECLWLVTQDWPGKPMRKELRPDRTGVVMEVNTHSAIIAHCRTGNEWQKESIFSILINYVSQGLKVLVGHHESYALLNLDGTTEQLRRIGVAQNGEVMYVLDRELKAAEAAK